MKVTLVEKELPHSQFIHRVVEFTSFLPHFILVISLIYTKMNLLITILLCLFCHRAHGTFGTHLIHLLPPHLRPVTTTTPIPFSSTESSFEPTSTAIIDFILDIANETLSMETNTMESVFEEFESSLDPVISAPPRTVCVTSKTLVILRWIERRLRRLFHALLELLIVPIEILRGALILLFESIVDTSFNLFGYDHQECRVKFTCEVSSFLSFYAPSPIKSLFERNWDIFVSVASRLHLLNFENDFMEAAILGAYDRNCTIFETTKCSTND